MALPVEHSIRSLDVVRPWRTATLVASAVAAVELVILVVVAVALLGNPVGERIRAEAEQARVVAANPPPPAAMRDGTPRLPRAATAVLILNGNGVTGAAGEAAERVRRLGYVVGAVGNAPRSDHTRSVVMYRDGYRPEAARLARDVGVSIVAPLDGLPLERLMGAHVVYVVAG